MSYGIGVLLCTLLPYTTDCVGGVLDFFRLGSFHPPCNAMVFQDQLMEEACDMHFEKSRKLVVAAGKQC